MTRLVRYLTPGVAALAMSSALLVAPAAPASAALITAPTVVSTWAQRLEAGYNAYQRHCSAPKAANTSVVGAKLTLQIKKQTSAAEKAAAQAAGCNKKLVKAGRVYSNAMVSTQNLWTVKAGVTTPTVVEAKIKFAAAKGMHGGVWLQSLGGPEIDMIESYGTRITHVHHYGGTTKNYGYKSIKKKSSWYKKAHTFRVEFTTSQIKYYIDGKLTNKASASLPADTEYFLVASLLSSDWEVKKIKNSKLSKSKMTVYSVSVTPGS